MPHPEFAAVRPDVPDLGLPAAGPRHRVAPCRFDGRAILGMDDVAGPERQQLRGVAPHDLAEPPVDAHEPPADHVDLGDSSSSHVEQRGERGVLLGEFLLHGANMRRWTGRFVEQAVHAGPKHIDAAPPGGEPELSF